MTYKREPTLCMVLSPQSCSNHTVGKKIPFNQLCQLITVFFPSWPWIFNHKFSRRWLKTDGDERSCSKQPLSHPWGEGRWRFPGFEGTLEKDAHLPKFSKLYFQIASWEWKDFWYQLIPTLLIRRIMYYVCRTAHTENEVAHLSWGPQGETYWTAMRLSKAKKRPDL